MSIKIQDITETYGALNDLGNDPGTPVGDRRLTTVSHALQRTLEQLYTPDALASKNHFKGLVLAALPSRLPRRSSKTAFFEAMDVLAGTSSGRIDPQMVWYYYKVYVPEIDPRCLDLAKRPLSPNLLQQVLSLDDTFMSVDLIEQGQNQKIATGTLVTVRYEDPRRATNGEIVELGPLVFPYDITGIQGQNTFPFGNDITTLGATLPEAADHVGPAVPRTGVEHAAQVTGDSVSAPDEVLECAQNYDNTPEASARYRGRNDKQIDILHAEFKPYVKCYIYKLHKELGASVSINSTYRSNDWQSDHRYWWLTEERKADGSLLQPVMAATSWNEETQRVPTSRKPNKVWKCNRCGSWHLVGWAFDHNVVLSDGTWLSTASSKVQWTGSKVVKIGRDVGLWWGVTNTLWDPIHWGGQNILKKLDPPFSINGAGGALQFAERQGVGWNKFTL